MNAAAVFQVGVVLEAACEELFYSLNHSIKVLGSYPNTCSSEGVLEAASNNQTLSLGFGWHN